ncbi:FMN-dependent NADH-azoreductase [Lacticaseibacillus hulanensis]|uniref:FMN-dependent NADH-azoreductase n=1 Tax=Lacticaseibacillus hulanensis TaxID=2493111 RepID=UPI000FDA992C|nr:NAD(P)H-dependent oxidoreductase [Lacticaseibacillus hulanensis]
MTTLLVIKAHPEPAPTSVSLKVMDAFLEEYKSAHPDDKVVIRDVYATPVPPINNSTFPAWAAVLGGTKPEDLSPEQKAMMGPANEWLGEFLSADKYLFVNPMYNHALPAELKQYIDVVEVPHATFRYTAQGPVGMLNGKKAAHIQAAGGFYQNADVTAAPQDDFAAPYLRAQLKLFGIDDFTGIYAEGMDTYPDRRDQFIAQACDRAREVAAKF